MTTEPQKAKRDWIPIIALLISTTIIIVGSLMQFASLKEDVSLMRRDVDTLIQRMDNFETKMDEGFNRLTQYHIDHLTFHASLPPTENKE